MGCLLHVCCKAKAMCCRIGKLKKYFRLKVVYMQVGITDMQDVVLLREIGIHFVILKRKDQLLKVK